MLKNAQNRPNMTDFVDGRTYGRTYGLTFLTLTQVEPENYLTMVEYSQWKLS